MDSITVDDKGTSFSFLDSGVPAQESVPYVTIIAVHGMEFANEGHGSRAQGQRASRRHTRRDYQGSTPFSEAEVASITAGTDGEKAAFIDARGIELATLVDKLIQRLDSILSPKMVNPEGLAYSAGLQVTHGLCPPSQTWKKLPVESQGRLAAHIQEHIMKEPPSICLGLPLPPKIWSPLIDTTIPEDTRVELYTSWITSYFDHGDLSTRDIDNISYYAPSLHRAPSIYKMSANEMKKVVDKGPLPLEMNIMVVAQSQSNAVYRKACFDPAIKKLLPNMKTSVLVGDAGASFAVNGLFSIQDDNDKNDGDIHFIGVSTSRGLEHRRLHISLESFFGFVPLHLGQVSLHS